MASVVGFGFRYRRVRDLLDLEAVCISHLGFGLL